MAIENVPVVSDNLMAWGITVNDYSYNGTSVDFQDLMIKITEKRATAVEGEITPMSTRMSTRNDKLEDLGNALAVISDIEGQVTSDTEGSDKITSQSTVSDSAKRGLAMVGWSGSLTSDGKLTLTKANAEYYQQMLKTKMDSYNNDSSQDMTRLQSLVDKRDESYSTATTLMQSIGDTRANTIKNM